MSSSDNNNVVDKIKDQLAWEGPNGKHLGHVVLTREDAQKLLSGIDAMLDDITAKFIKGRPTPRTLPDCAMPDGAEPCKGYVELYGSFAIKGGA